MSYKDETRHVFPRRINRQAPARPRQKVASVRKQKQLDWANPENRIKYMNFPAKRLDQHVQSQRKQMLIYSGKISSDTPDWWGSTNKYFKRSEMPRLYNTVQLAESRREGERGFDVFNRKKDTYMTVKNARMQSLYNNRSQFVGFQHSIDDRSNCSESRASNFSNRFKMNSSEVSPKVGSLDARDYSIKKPILKIGSNDYVNTYSCF